MSAIDFKIEKSLEKSLGRVGILDTPHGEILTPAFMPVATKGTLKALEPRQIEESGIQVMIANAYHLYHTPGDKIVAEAGGLHKFMNWNKPLLTDSGGFQVFSLGAAFNKQISKVAEEEEREEAISVYDEEVSSQHGRLAVVDEEGVTFTSHIDGSLHRFTPERSIEIQHNLGADIMFSFDDFVPTMAKEEDHIDSMRRTHVWAPRALKAHRQNTDAQKKQALFGIIQGGRFEHLRKQSAKEIGSHNFDGFGIGGSFTKKDMDTALRWAVEELPEEKPRHILGIGEPIDLFIGVENGADLFDCVAPTRMARNGTVYTSHGRINLSNEKFINDHTPIDPSIENYTSKYYTRAYLAHLFRSQEMLGATLASMHNIYFLNNLMQNIRQSILDNTYSVFKDNFVREYYA